jgi:uncharacterized membrane protein YdbT with pleckstrin-like domain
VPALALSENQELAPRASMSEIYDSIEQPRDDFFMSTGRVFFFCFVSGGGFSTLLFLIIIIIIIILLMTTTTTRRIDGLSNKLIKII